MTDTFLKVRRLTAMWVGGIKISMHLEMSLLANFKIGIFINAEPFILSITHKCRQFWLLLINKHIHLYYGGNHSNSLYEEYLSNYKNGKLYQYTSGKTFRFFGVDEISRENFLCQNWEFSEMSYVFESIVGFSFFCTIH